MPDHADKARRHKLILAVLQAKPVASQEELAAELEVHDVWVTQPTLSRDLRELRVTRVPTGDGYRYVRAGDGNGKGGGLAPERFKQLAALEVTGIDANEAVVAVRTMPGRAQGLAAYIDSLDLPELMATIAGDDTVIAHPRRTRQTARLRRRLREVLGVS
jgi:transcriptional regulator of arginine metabolism